MASAQDEATRLQYALRSTFFFRKRLQFKRILLEISSLDSNAYHWKDQSQLGISKNSFDQLAKSNIPLCGVFCHPDVILAKPYLITYYRSVAVIPQKGTHRLVFDVKPYEEKGRGITPKKALLLAQTLNSYASVLVDSTPGFSLEDARLAAMMNFGTQINGSWRNEIGAEGSRRVKELLVRYFLDSKKVTKLLGKSGTELPFPPLPEIDCVTGLVTTNAHTLAFASEPDVSLIDSSGTLEAVIEVKAGVDPAGALERYGAAKKSFDKALRENKSATTIYLASCITEGVKKAMADDRLVREDFNLTDIFTNEQARSAFRSHIQWLMHL